jgi:hypothetical protein
MHSDTIYKGNIKLIDAGKIPAQFESEIKRIMAGLEDKIANNKMTTFCITEIQSSVKILTLQKGEDVKQALDKQLPDNRRFLLFIKSSENVITFFICENGKVLYRESINDLGITKGVYQKVVKEANISGAAKEISIAESVEYIKMMEGVFFQGNPINKILYRISVSGFGDDGTLFTWDCNGIGGFICNAVVY